MKKAMLPAIIVSSALLNHLPAANAVTYQVSGMMCDAIGGVGANAKTQGLENKRASGDVWVACPVIKFGESDDMRVQVNLLNNSNLSNDVTCTLRERKEGKALGSSQGTVRLSGNAYSEEMFWEGQLDADTHANIMCKLPPGTSIESLTFTSSQDGSATGGSNGPGTTVESFACETAPTQSYYSSAQTVEFRNGMIINNYNGHRWYSSDQTTVFQTTSEDWHVITDADTGNSEVYRLDVIQEPSSCIEPSYGRAKSVSSDASGNKVLVFDALEITVGPDCSMNTQSKLLVYGKDYSTDWLMDVNTAEDCRVKDWREF